MKVVHRIGMSPDINQRLILMNLGIELPFSDNNLTEAVTLELLEEAEEYKKIRPYLESWQVMDAVATLFDEAEISNAPFLAMRDVWSHGYPMPDGSLGYMRTTYDDSHFCKECGTGLVQKEPFRIKKEPNWGAKQMFSLNWIYDELFVTPNLYDAVFSKYDIQALPVLLYKKDIIIDNVVQLQIPVADVNLELEKYSYKECSVCNRKRYDLINRGFFPAFTSKGADIHVVKSREIFGTGKNARKYIIFSSQVEKELRKHKVKCNYIPMEL